MNAITYLLQQHRKYKKRLQTLVKKSHRESTKRKMFTALTTDLKHHEKMEQTIWYPYLKKNTDLSNVIKHLVSEEKSAAKAIAKIKKIKDEEVFTQKIAELRKDVLHHARTEETKLFPKVTKYIGVSELNNLGKKMKKFKKQLDSK